MNVEDMKIMMVKNKDKGFTLAELLVVVAIIAILVAVSIVIFTGKQKEAKATVCEANRTSLKHHLAVDYMSGELEQLTDTVFQEYIKIDESVCPSGGTYSYSGNFESGFKIKCSYHDGDGSGGGTEAKSAVTNLIEAVEAFMDENNYKKNYLMIDNFFTEKGSKYQKYIQDIDMADIFNGVDFDYIAKTIAQLKNSTKSDKIKASIESYKNKTLKIVPYYSEAGGKVIPYYVNDTDYQKLKSGKNDHVESSVCYVEGNWYISSNLNGKKDEINGVYVKNVDDVYKYAKEKNKTVKQSMTDNGWIKLK